MTGIYLHTAIWYQVFSAYINNMLSVIWFDVFLSNIIKLYLYGSKNVLRESRRQVWPHN